jgi:DNA topoisomerase III
VDRFHHALDALLRWPVPQIHFSGLCRIHPPERVSQELNSPSGTLQIRVFSSLTVSFSLLMILRNCCSASSAHVVVGKQEMVGAIDAVCNVAERIIGKLKEGGTAGGPPLLGAVVGNGPKTFPPTPAMKRFADSLARQKGIKPPPGYKTSISICRKFLNEHAPKKAEGEATGKNEPKPVSPAQLLYAKKIAQGKGLIIPDEAKANSAAMSVWIDSNRSAKRRKRGRKTAVKPAGSVAPQLKATTKRSRKRKAYAAAAPPAPAQPNSVTGTPLRIPYGN